ncbi:MAG: hypothetical protein AAF847_15875 [Bacteroidota bacterium]
MEDTLSVEDYQILKEHLRRAAEESEREALTNTINHYLEAFQTGAGVTDFTSPLELAPLLKVLSRICGDYNQRRLFFRAALVDAVLRQKYNLEAQQCLIEHQIWTQQLLELRKVTKKIRV